MYRKILVPHGGTEAGDNAIEHAINIAKCNSSEIVILHVVEYWSDPSFGYWIENDSKTKEHVSHIVSDAETHARKLLAERVAQCRCSGCCNECNKGCKYRD